VGGLRSGSHVDDITRSTLLVRLRDKHDAEAWSTYEALYRPLVRAYAISRGLDESAADDVAQQCTQVVLERIAEYEHAGSFKSWLRAIAEHKIVDRFRSSRHEGGAGTAFWRGREATAGRADSRDPADAWERHWEHAHIMFCAERARTQVSESTYEAFDACVVRGMTPDVVAMLLNIPIDHVYVAKHRVLERIRVHLRELHGGEEPT
jgi:RNA polymerase sigma factor (sigma-70 family)